MSRFNHDQLKHLAVMCGTVAFLMVVALFISRGGIFALHTQTQGGPTITRSGDKVTVTFTNPVNGAAANAAAAVTTLTSSQSWTVPAGVTSVSVTVVGGGGGSGGAIYTGDDGGGAGGGSGGVNTQTLSVTSGQQISVVVGAGGAGGAYVPCNCGGTQYVGATGGGSSFGSVTASGGGGGAIGGGGLYTGGGAPGTPNGVKGADAIFYDCSPRAGGNNGTGYGMGGSFPGSCRVPGVAGQAGAVSITYVAPPTLNAPSCSPNGEFVTLSWNPVSVGGDTVYYAPRVDDPALSCGGDVNVVTGPANIGCTSGVEYVGGNPGTYTGQSAYFVITPGTSYQWWVNAYDATEGLWSGANVGSFSCGVPPPTCSISSVTGPPGSSGTGSVNYSTTNTPTSGTITYGTLPSGVSVSPTSSSFTPASSGSTPTGTFTNTNSSSQNVTVNMSVTSSGGTNSCSSTVTIPGNTPSPPTASIKATVGGVVTTSAHTNDNIVLNGTFAASSGDTLQETGITLPNDTSNYYSPSQNFSAPWASTYTYTPGTSGSYIFYARAHSASYPSDANYASVTVHVCDIGSNWNGSSCVTTAIPPTAALSANVGSNTSSNNALAITVGQTPTFTANFSKSSIDTFSVTGVADYTGTTMDASGNSSQWTPVAYSGWTGSVPGVYRFYARAGTVSFPAPTCSAGATQCDYIDVTVSCPGGTSWNGSSCVSPTTVTVSALDPTIYEPLASGIHSGNFKVVRTGDTSTALAVTLGISGATLGTDFTFSTPTTGATLKVGGTTFTSGQSTGSATASSISATIPAGQTFITITTAALDAAVGDGNKTLTLTVN